MMQSSEERQRGDLPDALNGARDRRACGRRTPVESSRLAARRVRFCQGERAAEPGS